MSRNSLKRFAPAVAAQFDELQDAIRNLGEGIGVALAAQKQEAEQQTAAPERALVRERLPTKEPIIEAEASSTRGYRARAVAKRLDIHVQTLWRWCREGRFPKGLKIGEMTTIWTEATIAEWLEEQRAKEPDASVRERLPRTRS